jgi:hypothetical protein
MTAFLNFYSALKDGYESDSTLVFKRKENYTPTPQTPTEAKAVYTQVTFIFLFYGPPKVPRCRRSFGRFGPLR